MSTQSPSELLAEFKDMSPTERKDTFEQLSTERERLFFEYRSTYAERIGELDEASRIRDLLEGTEFASIDFYLGEHSKLSYCLKNPNDCFRIANRFDDLLPSIVEFVEIRLDYLRKLEAEGLVEMERMYFGPSPGEVSAGDAEGDPALGLDSGVDTGPGGPDMPGRGGVSVTLTDDWPVDTSVDDIDDFLDRYDGVDVRVRRRPGHRTDEGRRDTDPRFERIKAFLDWFEKHYRDPDFDVSAHLTVRRSDQDDD